MNQPPMEPGSTRDYPHLRQWAATAGEDAAEVRRMLEELDRLRAVKRPPATTMDQRRSPDTWRI